MVWAQCHVSAYCGMANGPIEGPKLRQVVSADSPPSFPFALLGSDGAVGGSNSSQRLYNPSRVKSFGSVGRRPGPSETAPERGGEIAFIRTCTRALKARFAGLHRASSSAEGLKLQMGCYSASSAITRQNFSFPRRHAL